MQIWILYALIGAVFAGCVPIFAKFGLKAIDPTLATTVRSCIMTIFLMIVSFFLGKTHFINTIDKRSLILIALSGIAGALSWLFGFTALYYGPAAGTSAIDRLSVVFVFIFAVIFLGEAFTIQAVLGAGMIVIGAILMTLK